MASESIIWNGDQLHDFTHSYLPAPTLWFAAFMLPLSHAGPGQDAYSHVWYSFPACVLLVFSVAIQVIMLTYLHPIIWENDINCSEDPVLTLACSVTLSFIVVSGDLQDCSTTLHYIRCIPPTDDPSKPIRFSLSEIEGIWQVSEDGGGITLCWRIVGILLCVLHAVLSSAVWLYGIGYITVADADDDRIKDCVAFIILTELDDFFYKFAIPADVKKVLEGLPALKSLQPNSWDDISAVFGAIIKPIAVSVLVGVVHQEICFGITGHVGITFACLLLSGVCFRSFFSFCRCSHFSEQMRQHFEPSASTIGEPRVNQA